MSIRYVAIGQILKGSAGVSAALALTLGAPSVASAGLEVYEGFQYEQGTVLQDGASGAMGLGTYRGSTQFDPNNPFVIQSPGLALSDLQVSGQQASRSSGSGRAEASAPLSDNRFLANGNNIWVSALFQANALSGRAALGIGNGRFTTSHDVENGGTIYGFDLNGQGDHVDMKLAGFEDTNTAPQNMGEVTSTGGTHLLVMRIEPNADDVYDIVSGWLNPTVGEALGAPDTSMSRKARMQDGELEHLFNADETTFDQLSFVDNRDHGFDEIRIVEQGSNMTDQQAFELVAPVPEPASVSLLAMGGLAMLRRRRQHA
jgi:hypothetical protein